MSLPSLFSNQIPRIVGLVGRVPMVAHVHQPASDRCLLLRDIAPPATVLDGQ